MIRTMRVPTACAVAAALWWCPATVSTQTPTSPTSSSLQPQPAWQTPQTQQGPATDGPAAVDDRLRTATGHEVNVSVGSYTYAEPGTLPISIHGPKVRGEYTGTMSL